MIDAEKNLATFNDQTEHNKYPRLLLANITQQTKEMTRTSIKQHLAELSYLDVRRNATVTNPIKNKITFHYDTKLLHLIVTLIAEFDRLFEQIETLNLIAYNQKEVNRIFDSVKKGFFSFLALYYNLASTIKPSRNMTYLVADSAKMETALTRFSEEIAFQMINER